jgi:magnesium transporter
MSAVMKLLTIIATIFIPLSFIAGVYGMNFDRMPELHWDHGYFMALGLMGGVGALLLVYFWRRGWFR